MVGTLSEMGLTKAEVEAAIGRDPYVRAAVINMTNKVKETWQQIWDEAEYESGGVTPKQGGHPYETGQYKESLEVTYEYTATGMLIGTVRTRDRKAFWLEYGTKADTKQGSPWGPNTPTAEYAPARKTVDRLGGRRGADGVNWAGDVSS
jgi:hypothetical protein